MKTMETKHTPGPWFRQGNTVYALHQTGCDKGKPVMSNRFWVGVQIDYRNVPTEEQEANASLIAAAPESLETHQKNAELCDEILSMIQKDNTHGALLLLAALKVNCLTVIQKATTP
jgi:hypothetical protein